MLYFVLKSRFKEKILNVTGGNNFSRFNEVISRRLCQRQKVVIVPFPSI
ncbi:hypothetical protein yaldo0001_27490 [Yersinia aldovae ATCC 35236]|nr:hypothetical protein yaldo0001_27490 [Yersinia aldovae ATCC 35236]